MKTILEFAMPDDAQDLEYAQRGVDLYVTLHAFREWLFHEVDENGRRDWQPVLDKLNTTMDEREVLSLF